jgi:thiol-disulfide isomerase/thioredoxin
MKAAEITDRLIAELRSGRHRFARVNYANGDMVGHTGHLDATSSRWRRSTSSSPACAGPSTSSAASWWSPPITATPTRCSRAHTATKSAQASCSTADECLPTVDYHDIHKQPFKKSNLDGKVVVVNFWATWCGPCKKEIPAFNRTYIEYKGKGVEFLGVLYDNQVDDAGPAQLHERLRDDLPGHPRRHGRCSRPTPTRAPCPPPSSTTSKRQAPAQARRPASATRICATRSPRP